MIERSVKRDSLSFNSKGKRARNSRLSCCEKQAPREQTDKSKDIRQIARPRSALRSEILTKTIKDLMLNFLGMLNDLL